MGKAKTHVIRPLGQRTSEVDPSTNVTCWTIPQDVPHDVELVHNQDLCKIGLVSSHGSGNLKPVSTSSWGHILNPWEGICDHLVTSAMSE